MLNTLLGATRKHTLTASIRFHPQFDRNRNIPMHLSAHSNAKHVGLHDMTCAKIVKGLSDIQPNSTAAPLYEILKMHLKVDALRRQQRECVYYSSGQSD